MKNRAGQALVEAALAMPCLLILLSGLFVAGRAVSLAGSAESAVFAQTLREGRRQASIGKVIAHSIRRNGAGVSMRTDRDRVSAPVLSVFPSLEGRTRCAVGIDRDWKEAGRVASWPSLSAERRIEASVDCWDRKSPSGRKTSTVIRAYVLLRSVK